MTIYEKLFAIMQSVESLPKTAYNETEKYNYVPEEAITLSIKKLLIEHKLICLYSVENVEAFQHLSKVSITYKFINVEKPDEKISGKWVGEGENRMGYGTATAITTAIKQLLMKTFFIPTGEDQEKISGSSPSEPEPIVKPETIAPEPEIPGNKRKRRNPSKAIEHIEHISEQPEMKVEHESIPEPELPIETSPEETVSQITPSPVPIDKPDSSNLILVPLEQFKNGISQNMIVEIPKVEVINTRGKVYYAYDEDNKPIYAKVK